MKQFLFTILLALFSLLGLAQGPFSPAADSLGTTAIHMDSTTIVGWVNDATITRGLQNITNTSGPLADVGNEQSVYGKADGNVLSLGDGGSVIVNLSTPLINRPSYDFAVFENGFYNQGNGGYFLELAFVEVSSDGQNYYRFPNQSLTKTDIQKGTFGTTDPTNIDGLAGKYLITYGTPFDLAVLDTVTGLDINHITHIKIIDVVGTINPTYASYDSYGRIINDPYPTAFGSGGFDLDAIALLDSTFATSIENTEQKLWSMYPNPARESITITGIFNNPEVTITNMNGQIVFSSNIVTESISISHFVKGVYFVHIQDGTESYFQKFIKL